MAYTFPKIDFKKEMQDLTDRMKEMEANGEFDDVTGDIDDIDDSMTIEEARLIYNQCKYSLYYTEERMKEAGFGSDQINLIKGDQDSYYEAEEILKKAGER